MAKTLILVTNDDGVLAEGIRTLTSALKKISRVEVVVVAPESEQSATSHALTLHRPLRIMKKSTGIYSVDGTPTDCVMMGVGKICQRSPDLIVSGINHGGNIGDDVHYSGTVAAAIEGGIMGIPAIALSQLYWKKMNFKLAARFAQKIVKAVIKNKIPPGTVLNVNIPPRCRSLQYEITKTGKRDYGDIVIERKDPRGRPYHWIGGNQYAFVDIPGSDGNCISSGKISVTPLDINMTHHDFLDYMKDWDI